VVTVPLNIAFPHTKPFAKSVCIIKLISFIFVSEYLANDFTVLHQILKICHFLLHLSTTLNKLNIHIENLAFLSPENVDYKQTFRSNHLILS